MIPLANRLRTWSSLLSVLLALAVFLPYSASANARIPGIPAEPAAPRASSQKAIVPPLQSPPFTGDPVAPINPPALLSSGSHFYTETGHLVTGAFYSFYTSSSSSAELLGLPLSEEFPQQFADGSIWRVQYFERARLEWHPEMSSAQHIGLGALGAQLVTSRSFPRLPSLPSTTSRLYFPETGHTISNGFLSYWKTRGGLTVFGFPLSEEMGEDGRTVQYFERARFEYHKELEGTSYAVQLAPVGYQALKASHFNIPMGSLVRFLPQRLAEGHTTVVEVAAPAGVTVTGQYEGRELIFTQEPDRGTAWALLGAVPFQDTGTRAVTLNFANGDGGRRTVARNIEIGRYPFPQESVQFDPQTASLLDPNLTGPELDKLNAIFAGRTQIKYWDGLFRMPLDGKIRITSYFATRRCYNCPDGSTPTSYHGGMDMAAPVGSPVHAPANGKIVFAGKLDVRGNAIIVDHGLGVYSLFAHNSKFVATVGQMVKKGDVISLSGNTGLSNGPHLHWELHVAGPAVEPLEWVQRPMP